MSFIDRSSFIHFHRDITKIRTRSNKDFNFSCKEEAIQFIRDFTVLALNGMLATSWRDQWLSEWLYCDEAFLYELTFRKRFQMFANKIRYDIRSNKSFWSIIDMRNRTTTFLMNNFNPSNKLYFSWPTYFEYLFKCLLLCLWRIYFLIREGW